MSKNNKRIIIKILLIITVIISINNITKSAQQIKENTEIKTQWEDYINQRRR